MAPNKQNGDRRAQGAAAKNAITMLDYGTSAVKVTSIKSPWGSGSGGAS
jgi:hypothetical protein